MLCNSNHLRHPAKVSLEGQKTDQRFVCLGGEGLTTKRPRENVGFMEIFTILIVVVVTCRQTSTL